jgi:hypothetical protein
MWGILYNEVKPSISAFRSVSARLPQDMYRRFQYPDSVPDSSITIHLTTFSVSCRLLFSGSTFLSKLPPSGPSLSFLDSFFSGQQTVTRLVLLTFENYVLHTTDHSDVVLSTLKILYEFLSLAMPFL